MPKDLSAKVNFDILRYANCWEDADILLAGLQPEGGSRIISIGSAGDNSFSLLITNPANLTAIDISPVQLYLIELKKACFLNLAHEETLAFLGFNSSKTRIDLYKNVLKKSLSPEAAQYWDSHTQTIENGIIYAGKFEKYFKLFRTRILPLIHSRKTIDALFTLKSAAAQLDFYFKTWRNRRWRWLFRIFFSRFVMGRLGRDPQMLKEVGLNVQEYIFKRAEEQLLSPEAQDNYYLKFIMKGSFEETLPHYLRPENYEAIKANLDKLHLRLGLLEDVIEDIPFDYLNLSNIFEYMDQENFSRAAQKIAAHVSPGGAIAYWNLMVPRSISGLQPGHFSNDEVFCKALQAKDKCFFYNRFIVEKAI
jgi:S-adenosylmethionine-diacylglycerol 3-amino-3-carboxypropyl transferase